MTKFTSLSDVLERFGVDQRTAAAWAGTNQSKISRMSRRLWSQVDREVVIAILEKICEEVKDYEFSVIGASGDKVSSVSFRRSDAARVIFHPYRPNEC